MLWQYFQLQSELKSCRSFGCTPIEQVEGAHQCPVAPAKAASVPFLSDSDVNLLGLKFTVVTHSLPFCQQHFRHCKLTCLSKVWPPAGRCCPSTQSHTGELPRTSEIFKLHTKLNRTLRPKSSMPQLRQQHWWWTLGNCQLCWASGFGVGHPAFLPRCWSCFELGDFRGSLKFGSVTEIFGVIDLYKEKPMRVRMSHSRTLGFWNVRPELLASVSHTWWWIQLEPSSQVGKAAPILPVPIVCRCGPKSWTESGCI